MFGALDGELKPDLCDEEMVLIFRPRNPFFDRPQLLPGLRTWVRPVSLDSDVDDELVLRIEHEQALITDLTTRASERRLNSSIVLPGWRWVFDGYLTRLGEGERVDSVADFGWREAERRVVHLDESVRRLCDFGDSVEAQCNIDRSVVVIIMSRNRKALYLPCSVRNALMTIQ